MARFSSCKSSNLLSLFFTLFIALLTTQTAHAASYTFQTPTAATRWTPGQPGLITIVSTDKASASTPPTSRLLTITLRVGTGGLFGSSTTVATIKEGIQLLVPVGSATPSVTLVIQDWIVPATMPPGENKFFVHLARAKDGLFDIPDSVDSATFSVVAANTTVPVNPTPTATTTTATPTPTSTCNDIKEQCAAQSKVFQPASGSTPCSCGAALIVPNILDGNSNSAVGGKANVKSTFQSTGGPTAALVVLLLASMLF
ncbi:hypothetical protein EC991_007747 [Linnemannia zychae]|nr:hypothetical protein EC991_007747 [Linnemannia zychae]